VQAIQSLRLPPIFSLFPLVLSSPGTPLCDPPTIRIGNWLTFFITCSSESLYPLYLVSPPLFVSLFFHTFRLSLNRRCVLSNLDFSSLWHPCRCSFDDPRRCQLLLGHAHGRSRRFFLLSSRWSIPPTSFLAIPPSQRFYVGV